MSLRVTSLAVLLLFAAPLFSAPLSPADRYMVRLKQKKFLIQTRQQRDALERSIVLPRSELSAILAESTGPCLILQSIVLEGATLISSWQQQVLISPWLNRCLNLAQFTTITESISEWYTGKGFITSRAFLSGQDLSRRELRITVLEGKLRDLRLEGESSRLINMAFPGLKGKVLNLRDIEQGIEQINRVREEPLHIDILPDEQPGYSVVNLTATPEFPLSASVTLDNSGQKGTGEVQLSGVLSGNNLLGIADKTYISGGRNSDFATGYDAQNVQASLSVPYGYGLLDYSYSWSNYRTTFAHRGVDWIFSGESKTHRLNGSWVAYRNDDIKTTLAAGIVQRSSRNWLNDVRLKKYSHNFSSLVVGINHTQKAFGGVATFNPAFSRGVPWFKAETDTHKKPYEPRGKFRKWSLSTSFQRPLNADTVWLTSLYGQWSPDRLHGSERLSLGGESSVRGFKEQYISGDSGGYWRNELNYHLFSLPGIGQINAIGALDGGWLRKDPLDRFASGTLWGGAVGLSSNGRRFASQLTVGTPLQYPDWLGPDHVSVNWRISVIY